LSFAISLEKITVPYDKPDPSNAPTKNINGKISPSFVKRIGWGLVGLSAIATIWGIVDALHQLAIHRVSLLELFTGISFRLFPIIFAVLAALVINRQPANLIGWLMAIPVLGGILSFITDAYFQNVTTPPIAPSSFFLVMIWISSTSWTLFIFPIILIPLFFPDGRPPSPRWNWVKYYAAAVVVFFYGIATASKEISPTDATWTVTNPIGFLSNDIVDNVFGLPWAIAIISLVLVCIAALIVRYRRGMSVEKAQIKWVVYASLFFGIVYVTFFSFSNNNQFVNGLFNILFPLSLLVVPIGISIAILRYRLWDIDFVINRSLVYGALTALLVALFGGSLLIINGLFQSFVGGPFVAVAISAAVFGALFQPARRNLQRFVDRRFYNIQIDYNKTPAPALTGIASVIEQTQFGEYQNLELIGRGGMAEIYKSIHPTLGTPVAIKILPANLADDPDFRKRFIREAETVAKLQHPHIIRVFDYGEADGTNYMVMEYIEGKDLAHYLTKQGRLSLTESLPFLRGIADALDYAHAQGLIHRDVKPSNVLLDIRRDESGALQLKNEASALYPVLTDFGIAKILGGATRFTETGGMLGTFDYIAPEQIQGATNINGQADVYSFGVVAYQMLTGALPFQHHNPGALLMAHMLQPPPDTRDLAPDLSYDAAHAIQRAMAKRPEERFVTAGEFVRALL
jgi:hypothetical protein